MRRWSVCRVIPREVSLRCPGWACLEGSTDGREERGLERQKKPWWAGVLPGEKTQPQATKDT